MLWGTNFLNNTAHILPPLDMKIFFQSFIQLSRKERWYFGAIKRDKVLQKSGNPYSKTGKWFSWKSKKLLDWSQNCCDWQISWTWSVLWFRYCQNFESLFRWCHSWSFLPGNFAVVWSALLKVNTNVSLSVAVKKAKGQLLIGHVHCGAKTQNNIQNFGTLQWFDDIKIFGLVQFKTKALMSLHCTQF